MKEPRQLGNLDSLYPARIKRELAMMTPESFGKHVEDICTRPGKQGPPYCTRSIMDFLYKGGIPK